MAPLDALEVGTTIEAKLHDVWTTIIVTKIHRHTNQYMVCNIQNTGNEEIKGFILNNHAYNKSWRYQQKHQVLEEVKKHLNEALMYINRICTTGQLN